MLGRRSVLWLPYDEVCGAKYCTQAFFTAVRCADQYLDVCSMLLAACEAHSNVFTIHTHLPLIS